MIFVQCNKSNLLYCTVLVGLFLACGCQKQGRIDTITILHTNDVHAHLLPNADGQGGWANIAAYVRDLEKTQDNILLLDAGDMTQGTPVSTFFYGRPVFHVMNAVRYDAAVLGNHEFDNGVEYIRDFRDIAKFPLLSANLYTGDTLVADAPFVIINVDGVKVGIIGITTADYLCEGIRTKSPQDVLEQYGDELEGNTHLIIALTHLGVQQDRQLASDERIDVIVGGHSHTTLNTPLTVDGSLIVQSGDGGRCLGRLDLTIDLETEQILESHGELINIPVNALAPDSETKRIIDEWEAKVSDKVDINIGSNSIHLTTQQLEDRIEEIWQQTYETDFAYQNPGATRSDLPPGDILVRDIYNIMPFQDTIYILYLSRDQISEIIDKPTFTKDKVIWSCVTNSYAGENLIEHFNLSDDNIKRLSISWRQSIIDFIRENGHL